MAVWHSGLKMRKKFYQTFGTNVVATLPHKIKVFSKIFIIHLEPFSFDILSEKIHYPNIYEYKWKDQFLLSEVAINKKRIAIIYESQDIDYINLKIIGKLFSVFHCVDLRYYFFLWLFYQKNEIALNINKRQSLT